MEKNLGSHQKSSRWSFESYIIIHLRSDLMFREICLQIVWDQPGESKNYLQKVFFHLNERLEINFWRITNEKWEIHHSASPFSRHKLVLFVWRQFFVKFEVIHLMICGGCVWWSCVVMRVRAQMGAHMGRGYMTHWVRRIQICRTSPIAVS